MARESTESGSPTDTLRYPTALPRALRRAHSAPRGGVGPSASSLPYSQPNALATRRITSSTAAVPSSIARARVFSRHLLMYIQ